MLRNKIFFALMALVMMIFMIGACPPPPPCQYANDCSTWHVTATGNAGSGTIHVIGTMVVGDIPSWSATQDGRFIVIMDGEFNCGTCGVDDTKWTGKLIEDVTVPKGTTKIDLTFPADTSRDHDVVLYLGQRGCANCAQTLSIHVDWYYDPPKPIWLQLWTCTDGSLCFNMNVRPGPDAGCFIYDLDGATIPTSAVSLYCDPDPAAKGFSLVYSGWVTLPRPGTHQVWGPGGEGDTFLAKLNAEHGWHLAYAWFFKGYGGH
jgi:hypothetical protein